MDVIQFSLSYCMLVHLTCGFKAAPQSFKSHKAKIQTCMQVVAGFAREPFVKHLFKKSASKKVPRHVQRPPPPPPPHRLELVGCVSLGLCDLGHMLHAGSLGQCVHSC